MEEVSLARKQRRMAFETERAKKSKVAVDGVLKSHRTLWYQRWARRIDRNKYHAGGGRR